MADIRTQPNKQNPNPARPDAARNPNQPQGPRDAQKSNRDDRAAPRANDASRNADQNRPQAPRNEARANQQQRAPEQRQREERDNSAQDRE